MRAPILWAVVLALVSPIKAADPSPDLALKVRVALALNQCQCDTPGAHCADPAADLKAKVAAALAVAVQPPAPAKPPAHPTDADRYRAVLWRVYAGKEQTLLVGPDIPGDLARCDGWVSAGYCGLAAGLYRCYRADGRPVMEKVTAPAPNWLPGPSYVRPLDCVGGS